MTDIFPYPIRCLICPFEFVCSSPGRRRRRMGVLQHWHLSVHALRRRAPCDGRAHLQDQASEAGSLGGQPGGAHARGGQSARQNELRAQSAGMLSPTHRIRFTVSIHASTQIRDGSACELHSRYLGYLACIAIVRARCVRCGFHSSIHSCISGGRTIDLSGTRR